jgi:alkylation response protein AidB-like acyl-CoA dehydrogenase
MPWLSMFAYAITAPAIGAAVGALEAFIDENRTRVSAYGGPPAALNPAMHMRLADAFTVINDERRRSETTWNRWYAMAQATGDFIPTEGRARLRYEGVRAIGVCIEAVLKLFEVGGGRVMQTSKPLQRHVRDILAMAILGVPPDPFNPANLGYLI